MCSLNIQAAGKYLHLVLQDIRDKLERVNTDDERRSIVWRPISLSACHKLLAVEAADVRKATLSEMANPNPSQKTKTEDKEESLDALLQRARLSRDAFDQLPDSEDVTNPLLLAIFLGAFESFREFIKVVDNVNEVFSYNQHERTYTLAQYALTPWGILGVPFENRMKIIHILGEKKANFNTPVTIKEQTVYPLMRPCTVGFSDEKEGDLDLHACAVLYGAQTDYEWEERVSTTTAYKYLFPKGKLLSGHLRYTKLFLRP